MIVGLWVYGTAVALILAMGGLVMEPVAAHLRWPRRSDGAVALSLSDAMPTAMVARPHASAAAMRRIAIPETRFAGPLQRAKPPISVPAASAASPSVARSIVAYAPPIFDPILEIARGALPSGAGVVMILSWIRLRRARRHWRRNRIEGQELWVTPARGPAVDGLIRSQILLPRSLTDDWPPLRRMVLSDVSEHINARDPLLPFLGYLAVVLAPRVRCLSMPGGETPGFSICCRISNWVLGSGEQSSSVGSDRSMPMGPICRTRSSSGRTTRPDRQPAFGPP